MKTTLTITEHNEDQTGIALCSEGDNLTIEIDNGVEISTTDIDEYDVKNIIKFLASTF